MNARRAGAGAGPAEARTAFPILPTAFMASMVSMASMVLVASTVIVAPLAPAPCMAQTVEDAVGPTAITTKAAPGHEGTDAREGTRRERPDADLHWTYGENTRNHWIALEDGDEGEALATHRLEASCATLRLAADHDTLARLVAHSGKGSLLLRSRRDSVEADIVGIDRDDLSPSGWTLVAGIDPDRLYGLLRDADAVRLEVLDGEPRTVIATQALPTRRMGQAARLMANACRIEAGQP